MDFFLLNMIFITICTFGAIVMLLLIILRTRQLQGDEKKLSQRLNFWLSEKATVEQAIYGEGGQIRETKDETFAKRVLLPLGEQVGNWMADKVSYTEKGSKKLILIKAGLRHKAALPIFYSIKLVLAVLFGVGCFIFMSLSDPTKALGLSLTAAALGYIVPNFYLDKLAAKRQKNIDRVLPDALDLLVICTEAGMGIDQSLLRVASNLGKGGKDLQEEIILTNREMNFGQDRMVCWKNLGERSNSEELKNLAGVIIQSEKVGSAIAQVLRDQSEFMRVRRRQKAEETAAQMTVKMMLPMVLFIFPCIMAVTLGPPVLKIIATFSTMQ